MNINYDKSCNEMTNPKTPCKLCSHIHGPVNFETKV